jgi:hypothetical protein
MENKVEHKKGSKVPSSGMIILVEYIFAGGNDGSYEEVVALINPNKEGEITGHLNSPKKYQACMYQLWRISATVNILQSINVPWTFFVQSLGRATRVSKVVQFMVTSSGNAKS